MVNSPLMKPSRNELLTNEVAKAVMGGLSRSELGKASLRTIS
jgi:hypothetical protein